jgi:hypothetical protein
VRDDHGKDDQLPDWVLERYRAGALSEERRAQVERALREDAQVAARLAALGASDEEILRRYPPGWVRRQVEGRLHRQPQGRQVLPFALVLLTATAAVTLAVGLPSAEVRPVDRIKGGPGPQIEIFREGERSPLGEGDLAHAGDVLQIAVVQGEAPYGAIVSIDGRGGVTVHARQLRPGEGSGTIVLDQALKLDDAPAFERFFLVTGSQPIPVETLTSAARVLAKDPERARTAPLPIPSTFQQTDRLLEKEDSR